MGFGSPTRRTDKDSRITAHCHSSPTAALSPTWIDLPWSPQSTPFIFARSQVTERRCACSRRAQGHKVDFRLTFAVGLPLFSRKETCRQDVCGRQFTGGGGPSRVSAHNPGGERFTKEEPDSPASRPGEEPLAPPPSNLRERGAGPAAPGFLPADIRRDSKSPARLHGPKISLSSAADGTSGRLPYGSFGLDQANPLDAAQQWQSGDYGWRH